MTQIQTIPNFEAARQEGAAMARADNKNNASFHSEDREPALPDQIPTKVRDNSEKLPSLDKPLTCHNILEHANGILLERGEGYDSGEERSMETVVATFNGMSGHELSTKDGWRFMMILKLVRSFQGEDKLDNYVDLAGYAALAGEEHSQK